MFRAMDVPFGHANCYIKAVSIPYTMGQLTTIVSGYTAYFIVSLNAIILCYTMRTTVITSDYATLSSIVTTFGCDMFGYAASF